MSPNQKLKTAKLAEPPVGPRANTALSPQDVRQSDHFVAVTLQNLASEEIRAQEYILKPILQVGGLAMLVAERGIGKTHVANGMSLAAATGTSFFNWNAPEARRVLYIDGEMPQSMLQQRAKLMLAGLTASPPEASYFTILAMDRQRAGVSINLASLEDQESLEPFVSAAELIVIDNISTLVSSGRENDAESWEAMQRWLLGLRRRGKSVLLVHHAGRNGLARGTSKREDILDTVIQLKRPDDYTASEGARFEVRLTKSRGVAGDAAAPFEAKLEVANEKHVWTVSDLDDEGKAAVLELVKAGQSIREIAKETGISKSKVQRIKTKLEEDGLLT